METWRMKRRPAGGTRGGPVGRSSYATLTRALPAHADGRRCHRPPHAHSLEPWQGYPIFVERLGMLDAKRMEKEQLTEEQVGAGGAFEWLFNGRAQGWRRTPPWRSRGQGYGCLVADRLLRLPISPIPPLRPPRSCPTTCARWSSWGSSCSQRPRAARGAPLTRCAGRTIRARGAARGWGGPAASGSAPCLPHLQIPPIHLHPIKPPHPTPPSTPRSSPSWTPRGCRSAR
jgi:hypothetical protein